jgi:hypothetical protein
MAYSNGPSPKSLLTPTPQPAQYVIPIPAFAGMIG